MTKYDFDKIIDIRNTDCLKYDFAIQRGRPADVLPFLVADMDFPIAREIDEQYEQNCVVCTAPSKTFNIAGLQVSNIFIPNKNLRRRFRKQVAAAGYSQVNTLGLVACQAAYTYGEDCLQHAKAYIENNIKFVDAYLKQNLPQIKLLRPEGTYLIWLDCSALGLTAAEREQWLWHKAHLWLDGGDIFGKEGEAFERINVACPRALLLQGLEQLKQAVHELN